MPKVKMMAGVGYMPSNANSNFLTRIPEPVSTTYAPYKGGGMCTY